jgi:hypothetical protein
MIKDNHDGTITLIDVWTACSACGQKVTGDSIHTCLPQLKQLTDEEKWEVFTNLARSPDLRADMIRFADLILRKAQK